MALASLRSWGDMQMLAQNSNGVKAINIFGVKNQPKHCNAHLEAYTLLDW